jgi:uncharacterized protein (DUF58 family)
LYITPRGIFAAALGLAIALLPALVSPRLWPLWVGFLGVLGLALGVGALSAPRGSDITHSLVCPDKLAMGEAGALELRLASRVRSAAPAEVRLDVSETLTRPPVAKIWLRPEGDLARLPLSATRRGKAEIEAAWLRYAGPLGLVARVVTIELRRALEAAPDVAGVERAALRFFGAKEPRAGLKLERYAGDGSEFDALREFAQGEDRRAIDWKASARHTKLLARQFRAERNHQIVLAVDAGRLMAEPLGQMPRLDHAISAAMLLAYVGARAGDRVGFYAFDAQPRGYAEPRSGMAGFRAVASLSAGLRYSEDETNYTLGLTSLLARLSRRSLVVVLTDFVDSITAQLMVENLGRLSKRHLVVFVALRDPLLEQLTAAAPRAVLDLNRAVVADTFREEREIVLRRLIRHGVYCVDAAPDRVGPELLNRYLDIKRRELIA